MTDHHDRHHDLEQQFRQAFHGAAADLDVGSTPDLDDLERRRVRAGRRRLGVLLGSAALVLVVAGVLAASFLRSNDDAQMVAAPAPTTSTSTSTSTSTTSTTSTSTTSTTTSTTSTTTPEPSAPAPTAPVPPEQPPEPRLPPATNQPAPPPPPPVVVPSCTTPSSTDARQVLAWLNDTRSTNGLDQVCASADFQGSAQAWAAHLSNIGRLEHSTFGSSYIPPGATYAAEIVGYGSTLRSAYDGFLNSQRHLGIIRGNFDQADVGVVRGGGNYWVVVQFARY